MNLGSIGAEGTYGTGSYETINRKNVAWRKQRGNFVTNEMVQEDLDKKVGGNSERKEKADRIVDDKVNGRNPGNWSVLADDNGVITYNGITFLFDSETNSLSLGDMSQKDNVLSIPLSRGGTLNVNRNNIDDLAKAIGMFSPEDINRIMRAISQDAQCRRKLNEIEEDKNSLGEEEDSVKETVNNTQNFYESDNFKRVWNEYFRGADKDVERVWKETMEETGVDGFGYNSRGMLTHITQFQIAQLTMSYRQQSVFGSTVSSALDFARRSLDAIKNPLMPLSSRSAEVRSAIMAEQRFYEKFIEKLNTIKKEPQEAEETGETHNETNIVVKPDGSRVLEVTTNFGSMQTNMSIKISDPTDMPNDNHSVTSGEQEAGYMFGEEMAEDL